VHAYSYASILDNKLNNQLQSC